MKGRRKINWAADYVCRTHISRPQAAIPCKGNSHHQPQAEWPKFSEYYHHAYFLSAQQSYNFAEKQVGPWANFVSRAFQLAACHLAVSGFGPADEFDGRA